MTEATQALIIGSTGGIGRALLEQVRASGRYDLVTGLSRSGSPAIEITKEASIASAMEVVAGQGALRLVVIATGFLHSSGIAPEKANRQMSAQALAQAFAVNTIGPALVLKHVLPLLPRSGRSVVMALSAKVGSISDNRLGAGTAIGRPRPRSTRSCAPVPSNWRERTGRPFWSACIREPSIRSFRGHSPGRASMCNSPKGPPARSLRASSD
ncbi:Rossmann-fold NAD(P)-binding domain-containing protein [Pelagibacterium flavum]|uniref:hypothetical protein n=1 Tax=Pelagibacterium flavum TaxID=2984530 RepID=UPI00299F601F|nr:hypothetical protein [Pelagibacterium sp. YIM 151497]